MEDIELTRAIYRRLCVVGTMNDVCNYADHLEEHGFVIVPIKFNNATVITRVRQNETIFNNLTNKIQKLVQELKKEAMGKRETTQKATLTAEFCMTMYLLQQAKELNQDTDNNNEPTDDKFVMIPPFEFDTANSKENTKNPEYQVLKDTLHRKFEVKSDIGSTKFFTQLDNYKKSDFSSKIATNGHVHLEYVFNGDTLHLYLGKTHFHNLAEKVVNGKQAQDMENLKQKLCWGVKHQNMLAMYGETRKNMYVSSVRNEIAAKLTNFRLFQNAMICNAAHYSNIPRYHFYKTNNTGEQFGNAIARIREDVTVRGRKWSRGMHKNKLMQQENDSNQNDSVYWHMTQVNDFRQTDLQKMKMWVNLNTNYTQRFHYLINSHKDKDRNPLLHFPRNQEDLPIEEFTSLYVKDCFDNLYATHALQPNDRGTHFLRDLRINMSKKGFVRDNMLQEDATSKFVLMHPEQDTQTKEIVELMRTKPNGTKRSYSLFNAENKQWCMVNNYTVVKRHFDRMQSNPKNSAECKHSFLITEAALETFEHTLDQVTDSNREVKSVLWDIAWAHATQYSSNTRTLEKTQESVLWNVWVSKIKHHQRQVPTNNVSWTQCSLSDIKFDPRKDPAGTQILQIKSTSGSQDFVFATTEIGALDNNLGYWRFIENKWIQTKHLYVTNGSNFDVVCIDSNQQYIWVVIRTQDYKHYARYYTRDEIEGTNENTELSEELYKDFRQVREHINFKCAAQEDGLIVAQCIPIMRLYMRENNQQKEEILDENQYKIGMYQNKTQIVLQESSRNTEKKQESDILIELDKEINALLENENETPIRYTTPISFPTPYETTNEDSTRTNNTDNAYFTENDTILHLSIVRSNKPQEFEDITKVHNVGEMKQNMLPIIHTDESICIYFIDSVGLKHWKYVKVNQPTGTPDINCMLYHKENNLGIIAWSANEQTYWSADVDEKWLGSHESNVVINVWNQCKKQHKSTETKAFNTATDWTCPHIDYKHVEAYMKEKSTLHYELTTAHQLRDTQIQLSEDLCMQQHDYKKKKVSTKTNITQQKFDQELMKKWTQFVETLHDQALTNDVQAAYNRIIEAKQTLNFEDTKQDDSEYESLKQAVSILEGANVQNKSLKQMITTQILWANILFAEIEMMAQTKIQDYNEILNTRNDLLDQYTAKMPYTQAIDNITKAVSTYNEYLSTKDKYTQLKQQIKEKRVKQIAALSAHAFYESKSVNVPPNHAVVFNDMLATNEFMSDTNETNLVRLYGELLISNNIEEHDENVNFTYTHDQKNAIVKYKQV